MTPVDADRQPRLGGGILNGSARPLDRFRAALTELLDIVCPGWVPPAAPDGEALAIDEDVAARRWRLGEALAADPHAAREHAAEIVAAIALDHDVSLDHQLVEPLLVATCHERTLGLLLPHLESTDLVRQTGAARAWYWASMPIGIPYPFPYALTPRTTDDEVRELPGLARRLTPRLRLACLRAFVDESGDRDMRRYLGGRVSLDPDAYGADVRPLLQRAERIIAADPDLGFLIRG